MPPQSPKRRDLSRLYKNVPRASKPSANPPNANAGLFRPKVAATPAEQLPGGVMGDNFWGFFSPPFVTNISHRHLVIHAILLPEIA